MAKLRVPVTKNDHILGAEDAPVTLLEYGDYQCPFCGQAYPIVNVIIAHFGDDLRYVFRHFPLTQVHPLAESAAETAEFAGSYGRFWDMHNGLYENQDQLGLPLYAELADELGLPSDELPLALDAETFAPVVREQFMSGVWSGVTGTPTFFINGERHEGLYDFETLTDAINRELRRTSGRQQRSA